MKILDSEFCFVFSYHCLEIYHDILMAVCHLLLCGPNILSTARYITYRNKIWVHLQEYFIFRVLTVICIDERKPIEKENMHENVK